MLAANRFVARENGRSVIVVLALADDAHSTATLDDALRALKKRGITAYVLEVEAERVGVGSILETVARRSTRIRRDDFDIPNVFSGDSQVRIARLAEETGGRMIRVKGFGKLRSAFAEIAEDLRQQLVVTFTPSNVTDAGLRHLEIQTRIKRGRVYAANGYYVTPKPQP
jgi:hypothetical protein